MSDLTNEERETHLNQSATDRKTWEMATDDPVWIARMERLGIAPDYNRGATHFYTIDDAWVSVRRPRQYSEEQRRQMAERLSAARTTQASAGTPDAQRVG